MTSSGSLNNYSSVFDSSLVQLTVNLSLPDSILSVVSSQSYPEKFTRIAPQTSFRYLEKSEQDAVKGLAEAEFFTLQELQQISDMALDRARWKEPSVVTVWQSIVGDAKVTPAKKQMMSKLRKSHEQLRSGMRSYNKSSPAEKLKTIKPVLNTRVRNKLGLGRCPVASEKTRCCNLLTLDAVEKCGFDCSYCSIQSFYHGNQVTFDETFADKLAELKLDPNQTYHIGTGQSSDSLMWGNHQGVLDALSEFARRNPNVILELKTKSKNISWLLENDYPENIICTWSLNPQTVIEFEEHLTASLEQRITCAEKIAGKGRLVGFHFHPIMMYGEWKTDYQNICSNIVERFSPEEVALISMGTLTFTKSVMKTIRQRPFYSKILQMPMEEIAGKYSYPLEHKVEMFKTVYDALNPWSQDVFFYLCMEAQSLWKPVFGYEFETNIALESAMKGAYLKKIENLKRH